MKRIAFYSLLFLLNLPLAETRAQVPQPSPSEPLFQERPFGPLPPATPTPMRKQKEPEQPIPIGWIIGGVAFVVIGAAAFLYGSARQWHSSNLFDRQYRFPRASRVAVRFGAQRCGGHMATIRLGNKKRER